MLPDERAPARLKIDESHGGNPDRAALSRCVGPHHSGGRTCVAVLHRGATMDRILLVDDDVEVRPLLEHILLDNGFRVTTAVSVPIATELLSAQPFDLAICDVNLPDASGLAVADKAIAAGVKALVVIGRGAGLKPGSLARYNYLLKPLHVTKLLDGTERCLTD